jgi:hypothetical protein
MVLSKAMLFFMITKLIVGIGWCTNSYINKKKDACNKVVAYESYRSRKIQKQKPILIKEIMPSLKEKKDKKDKIKPKNNKDIWAPSLGSIDGSKR